MKVLDGRRNNRFPTETTRGGRRRLRRFPPSPSRYPQTVGHVELEGSMLCTACEAGRGDSGDWLLIMRGEPVSRVKRDDDHRFCVLVENAGVHCG